MADHYGALPIPAPAPPANTPVGDPGLDIYAQFFAAVLNARAQDAWSAVQPPVTGLATVADGLVNPVVRTVLEHNPEEISFDEKQLPAIYLDRTGGGEPYWLAEDYRNTHDVWRLLWIFPTAQQYSQKQRNSFTNAIVKVLDRAIEQMRDPAFVYDTDPDPTARTTAAAPSAIKLAIASDTSDQVYSGGALNGATGGAVFTPARLPSVRVAGTVGDVIAGTVVEFTGLGADGEERVSRVEIDAIAGDYFGDWSLTQVTSIAQPAQSGTGATFTYGLAAFAGLGTFAQRLAMVQRINITSWKDRAVVIEMSPGDPSRTYDALEIQFAVTERLIPDLNLLDENADVRIQVPIAGTTGNAEILTTAQFS